jgi:LysM repeat protein
MKNRILKLVFFSAGSFILFTLQGCITTESFGSGRGAGAKHKGTWRHEHKATINKYDIADINANSLAGEVYEPIIVSSEITEVISQPPTDIYVVESGDVLSQIALDFDTTTATLIELNNLSNPDLLTVGQEIQVPVNSSTFKKVKSQKISQNIKKGGSYVIQSGDTLSEIAFAAGVDIADLRSLNNINGDKIFAGQTIDIPDYGQIPSEQSNEENLIDIPLEDKLNLSNDDLSESSPSQDLDNSIIISVDEVIIAAGETLGDIAREQGVSIDEIRRENISLEGLSDDNLESLVGTKLRIPRGL